MERLAQLSAYARKGLTERGLSLRPTETPIIPIYTYDAIRTLAKAKELYDAGVYVNPVLPPATPDGECLLRTSYMASHTEAVLDEAHGLHCGSHRKGLPMKTGKVVLLTGGSSGIGQCTAQSLVKAGCRVYVSAAGQQPARHHPSGLRCDPGGQVQAAVKTVLDREGRIDVVVNNAGFGISGAVEFTKTEDAQRLLDVNFFGMVRVNRAVLPHMRKAGGGRIVNLSSVAAVAPFHSRPTIPPPRRRSMPIPWLWPMRCGPLALRFVLCSRGTLPRASPPPGRNLLLGMPPTVAGLAALWTGWSMMRPRVCLPQPPGPSSAGWP